MKYFYEYKYKNGNKVGGHNLEDIQVYEDIIILKGIDITPKDDYEHHYWTQRLDMNEIEYFKIEPMREDKEC